MIKKIMMTVLAITFASGVDAMHDIVESNIAAAKAERAVWLSTHLEQAYVQASKLANGKMELRAWLDEKVAKPQSGSSYRQEQEEDLLKQLREDPSLSETLQEARALKGMMHYMDCYRISYIDWFRKEQKLIYTKTFTSLDRQEFMNNLDRQRGSLKEKQKQIQEHDKLLQKHLENSENRCYACWDRSELDKKQLVHVIIVI